MWDWIKFIRVCVCSVKVEVDLMLSFALHVSFLILRSAFYFLLWSCARFGSYIQRQNGTRAFYV